MLTSFYNAVYLETSQGNKAMTTSKQSIGDTMNIENTLRNTLENNSALLSDTGLNAGQVVAMAYDLFNNEFDCDVDYSRESQLFFWDCVDDVVSNARRIQRHEAARCL